MESLVYLGLVFVYRSSRQGDSGATSVCIGLEPIRVAHEARRSMHISPSEDTDNTDKLKISHKQ